MSWEKGGGHRWRRSKTSVGTSCGGNNRPSMFWARIDFSTAFNSTCAARTALSFQLSDFELSASRLQTSQWETSAHGSALGFSNQTSVAATKLSCGLSHQPRQHPTYFDSRDHAWRKPGRAPHAVKSGEDSDS